MNQTPCNELTVHATVENLTSVQAFVESELERVGCPMKTMLQFSIAVEEIYVNIAHYAYACPPGKATVRFWTEGSPAYAVVQFLDSGMPFNPLEKPDADITQSAAERQIGGLGILMVKKSMDDMIYAYENGYNILTLRKRLL